MTRVVVFFDADVLIAGSASKTGASFALIQLSELNIIQGITCDQVISECKRNLEKKIPEALEPFENIISRTITVSADPNKKECLKYTQMVHEKDLPILASAVQNHAKYLVTFNVKHYYPNPSTPIQVVQPKELLHQIRTILSDL
jgi:predicted nucleic acid-binding protein